MKPVAFVVETILHNLFKYYVTADVSKIKISVLGNATFVSTVTSEKSDYFCQNVFIPKIKNIVGLKAHSQV